MAAKAETSPRISPVSFTNELNTEGRGERIRKFMQMKAMGNEFMSSRKAVLALIDLGLEAVDQKSPITKKR